ncbi:MAG TPA: OB-fold nucleic acid binding domain-containing protein, partial [Candidatus Paceibacterota bacterium]
MQPSDPIEKHFTRLKPDQKRALAKLGIRTIEDLLYHYPARYEAAGPTGTIAGAAPGAEVTLYGTVRKPDVRKAWKSRRPIAEAWLEDASGRIKMMWFNQPYIAKTLADGMVVKATGKITGTGEKPYLANPAIDRSPVSPEDVHENLFAAGNLPEGDALFPIYSESKGVSSLWLYHAVKKVLEANAQERLDDPIPADILERYNLPTLHTALVWVHMPRRRSDADAARKRFAFQEIFALQVAMARRRQAALKER